jgi:hypothetical protein
MGANEKPIYTESFTAGADLSSNQYLGHKLNADRQVILFAAITDVPVGVLLNNPDASGKGAEILVLGRCPVIAGETLSAGDLLRFFSNGRAYIWAPGTDTTTYIVGQCIEGADAGEYAVAMINCINPARGDC